MSRVLVDSGIKWIGSLPNTWGTTTVNKIFYRRKEVNDVENPTVLSLARDGVKIRDISTNEGQLAESYDNYHKVYKDDLMINPMDLISGANCSLSEVEGVISPAYINLAKKENIFPKYYDYFFKYQYWVNAMFIHGKGVSFNNRWTMNWETMSSYKLPFPKFEEQKKIANYLDYQCKKIDEIIVSNNRQIQLLNEYKKSIISSTVLRGLNKIKFYDIHDSWINKIPEGWDLTNIKSMFNFRKGLSITKDNLTESGIKVISYGQIHSKINTGTSLSNELYRYVSDSYLNQTNSLVEYGDFIFADTSEDLDGCGNSVFIDNNDKIFAGYHTIILHNNSNKKSKYFAYLFMTDEWRSQIRKNVFGVKLYSITQKILKGTSILIPPQKEQNEIVEFLDKQCTGLDEVIKYRKQIIEKLEEYKKSLIYECVTGKREV